MDKFDKAIEKLKQGQMWIVDLKTNPNLPRLFEMADKGILNAELREYDEQSSAYIFTWNKDQPEAA